MAQGARRRAALAEIAPFSAATVAELDAVVANFSTEDGEAVKAIEATTNHDVKAMEYWLKKRLGHNAEVMKVSEFIHFACTSEDINNTSHALMLAEGRDRGAAAGARCRHRQASANWRMRSPTCRCCRAPTASPPAPTTLGKEMANIAARLMCARAAIAGVAMCAKFNGAVGNYNAHLSAWPAFDWEGFKPPLHRIAWPDLQRIHHPDRAARCHGRAVRRRRARQHHADRRLPRHLDVHLAGLLQAEAEGRRGRLLDHAAQGQPIDFENAEGNFGLANAVLKHSPKAADLAHAARPHRFHRAAQHGRGLGHTVLALDSCLRGLGKLEANPARLAADLDECWEVLAEPVQTVMRRYGIENPYEQLRAMTRGKGHHARGPAGVHPHAGDARRGATTCWR